ncbi:CNDP dipeptidase [Aspergillus stella-maris]|uniref:CNDP dipeptidase n=1 Tax=Aspergillus stella-maris TaxID=1810926 RepID=UPI003CCDBFBA
MGLRDLLQRVDTLENNFLERLRQAIEIPSVSADLDSRHHVLKMAQWIVAEMKSLGVDAHLKPLGKQPGTDGTADLPPLVLKRLGNDPQKMTLLVYSHYDIQPAALSAGWKYDPWTLTVEPDGMLRGRGTSDDKGPLVSWLNMIQAYRASGRDVPVPVNLIFCLEGIEESGSVGFRGAIEDEADEFLSGIDAVCITDTVWAGERHPSITCGLRGVLFYILWITGAKKDAHSGSFGGVISEPMTDMVRVMSSLVDSSGRVHIAGMYDDVAPVMGLERQRYEELHVSDAELLGGEIGGRSLHKGKADMLIARWRMPSLTIHRIENAKPSASATTSIPADLIGKFSIRSVPNMQVTTVDQLPRRHIATQFENLGSQNSLSLECAHQSDWFFEDTDHWNYQAARNATEEVWGVAPDLACEGGSIPVALDLKQVFGKSVLLLPVGRPSDSAHSINKKLDRVNYFNATKLYAAYLEELAHLWRKNNLFDGAV